MKTPIENIEQIRKAKGLSREYVAKKLDTSLTNYGKMENGDVNLTIDRLYQLAEVFNMPPEDILTYNKAKQGNVTYIPIEAQAGFLSGYSQVPVTEFKTYNLPFLEGKNLYMIDAAGDSMFPVIQHGDKIVIDQIDSWQEVKFGCIYMIVSKEGRVIKRMYSSPENKKKVILKSDNPVYEPYTLDRQDIISIWLYKDYFIRSNLLPATSLLPEQAELLLSRKKPLK